MKTLAIFSFSLFLVQMVRGQACTEMPKKLTGNLIATVYDADSKEPIYRAAVKIKEIMKGAYTQEATKGQAKVVNVESGTYTVEVTFPGYEKAVIKGVVIGPGNTPNLTIWLKPKQIIKCYFLFEPSVNQCQTLEVVEERQIDNVTVTQLNSLEEKEAIVQNTMEVFPNPASGSTHLRFRAEPGESVTIRLCNSKGAIVEQQVFAPSVVGNHVVPLNLADIPSGDYFVHLVVRDRSLMKRLTVLK